jgi:hypothetical protein
MNSAEITPQLAAMMNAKDRKALGVLTLDERERKVEGIAERELQRLCEQELSRRGIVYLHLSFRAREKAGWPDLTFVLSARNCWGIPMAVELKTANGKLSSDQESTLKRMGENGWRVRVCRSFEQFREIITEGK